MSAGELAVPAAGPSPPATDPAGDRYAEVESKHRQVTELLERHGCDGLLLVRPANFAWFTGGATCPVHAGGDVLAALFVTREARVVLTCNTCSAWLFDKELARLGFQLKERSWQESPQVLWDDVCRGRAIAGDAMRPGARDVGDELAGMRRVLQPIESDRLRPLALWVAHAVEATARNLAMQDTEAEIAGQLAHRLLHRGVTPVQLQVQADDRSARYRHAAITQSGLRQSVTLTAWGRQHGLLARCTRTVHFGEISAELRQQYHDAAMVLATAIRFSEPGQTLTRIWERIARIYEKTGHPDEWQHGEQGGVIDYEPANPALVPGCPLVLVPQLALQWSPGVGPVQLGETIFLGPQGTEFLTSTGQWPTLTMSVKSRHITLPQLLVRQTGS